MAVEISPMRKKKPPGFMTLLSSAACEWFLIFLLFLDAAFAYLIARFARYCELETPCLLCSRLDLVFGKKKPECYWSVLCTHHREEISSLASCTVHGKVADVHGMCEECLMPIAKNNKSNPECYRLLVGKLWVDVEQSVLQHLLLNKYVQLGFSGRRTCSCCNKTWRAKSNADRLLEFTQVGLGASKANVKPPLPRVPGRSRFSRRDSLKRIRDKFTGPMPVNSTVSDTGDSLSYVGYSKLKISSDSESEITISEDEDDGNASTRGKSYATSEDDVHFSRSGLTKRPADNVVSEKQTNQSFQSKSVILDQLNLLDLSEHKNINSLSSDVLTEYGLRELDWADSFHTPRPSFTEERIILDDGYHTPDAGGDSISAPSAGMSHSGVSPPHMPALSVLSEILSLYNGPSPSSTLAIPEKPSNAEGTGGNGNVSPIKQMKAASSDDASSSGSNSKNLTDASVQSSENRESSGGRAVKPVTTFDSAKTEEDMKTLPQVSTSEVGLPSKDNSSGPHVKHGESRKDEDYSSHALLISASVVKNESEKDEGSSSQVLATSASPVKDDSGKDGASISQAPSISTSLVKDSSKKDDDLSSHTLAISASLVKDDFKKDEGSISQALSVSALPVKDSSRKDEDSSPQTLPISASLGKNDTEKDEGSVSQVLSVSASQVNSTSRKDEDYKSHAPPIVRNESSYESLDGITVSYVEGESVVDLLKRQIDHDRTLMNSLYDKLEEERNASSIAENEAMAMITRLQEEKEALHMEALQYFSTPRVQNYSKEDEDSSSHASPIARNESSYESLDGITVSYIEGESVADLLKRQVDHDRTLMNSLYKELEEERNASSMAVNEAMEMVTRLQEEKAALHMEASQYVSTPLVNNDSKKDEDSSSQVLPVSASMVKNDYRKDVDSSSQALPISASLVKDEGSISQVSSISDTPVKSSPRKDEDSNSQAPPISASVVKNDSNKDEDFNSEVLPVSAVMAKNDFRKDEDSSCQALPVSTSPEINDSRKDERSISQVLPIAASLVNDSSRKDEDSGSQALPVSGSLVEDSTRIDEDSRSQMLNSELRKDEVSISQALPMSSQVQNETRKDEDSNSQVLPVSASLVLNDSKEDADSSSGVLPISASLVTSDSKEAEDPKSLVLPIPASMVTNDSKKDEDSSSQLLPVSTPLVKNDSEKDEDSSSHAPPIVKNESGYESLDGITISYIEGESVVDLLKRQVDHDRTLMNSLYKELEEERNASSIAANEAMAMITRLQEEKAALHMEALQYLRMMEEQAEYDMEALERANTLLAEKEKELQDLEYELEFYRMNILDESGEQDIHSETPVEKNEVAVHTENGPSTSNHTKSTEVFKANGDHKPTDSSVSKFEDEKLYISRCVRKLEEKLHQVYHGAKLDEVPNGLNSENNKAVVNDLKDLPPNSQTMLNKEDSSLVQKEGNPSKDTASNGAMVGDKENDNKLSASRGEMISDTQREIAQLRDRLAALEADREFLRHASDLTQNGKDGLHFIQEIAHQLQELRKLEFRKE